MLLLLPLLLLLLPLLLLLLLLLLLELGDVLMKALDERMQLEHLLPVLGQLPWLRPRHLQARGANHLLHADHRYELLSLLEAGHMREAGLERRSGHRGEQSGRVEDVLRNRVG